MTYVYDLDKPGREHPTSVRLTSALRLRAQTRAKQDGIAVNRMIAKALLEYLDRGDMPVKNVHGIDMSAIEERLRGIIQVLPAARESQVATLLRQLADKIDAAG